MALPRPIKPQTLARLDRNLYETIKPHLILSGQILEHLGPGKSIDGSHFKSDQGLSVNVVEGTLRRGRATVAINQGVPNPSVTLSFPKGEFDQQPFATVVNNGGTGILPFSYAESVNGLKITIAGAPVPGTTYIFQWLVRD